MQKSQDSNNVSNMSRRAQTPQTMNWREALANNQRRTYFVMGIFIAIYVALGFLLDIYIHSDIIKTSITFSFQQLITFQVIPYATITMGAVAVISILIAYALYDRIMLLGTRYYEITAENISNLQERQFYHIVEELKIAAGLRYMPRVFIINEDYMNAFASGYSEKSAMIVVTQGLLNKLDRAEIQAVVAHELSHIRHGDIKLTLTASILSNLMLIAIDLLFYNMLFGRGRGRQGNQLLFVIVLLRYLLPVITVLLLLYLSRTREYMADAGAVELTRDNQPLGSALLKISRDYERNQERYQATPQQHEDVRRAAYIFDPVSMGFRVVKSVNNLFSTHPPLKKRLRAIGFKNIDV